ncbi:MAG: hypothetical protein D6695_08545 [Planctomycetota bacterium]|nr:MAG: hypothetical protein D6695_08545 [Planctomycetota bacterium]
MPRSRPHHHATPGGRAFALAVVFLSIFGLLPVRPVGTWLTPFSELAYRVIAPVSHPISEVSRWVAPGRIESLVDDPEQVLAEELERTRQALLREKLENERLRSIIEDLQRGFALDPGTAVRPLTCAVIGNPSDLTAGLLTVRAGKNAGVTTHTVATYQGIQLVGRVERVLGSVSEVLPITTRRAGRLDGVVMLDDDGAHMLACSLTPTGDGTLRGPVTEPRTPDPEHPLAVGQDVRLRVTDGSWPDSAQMLLLGRVIEIEPAPGQPLRRWIRVQPIADLRAVSQVVLRIPIEQTLESRP